MIRHAALAILLLGTAPLAAQEQGWSPEGWTPDGWTVEPLEELPPGDQMLRDLNPDDGQPLEMIPREDPLVMDRQNIATQTTIAAETAPAGALLRGLDKVSGDTVDLALAPGETGRVGRIEVTLQECRYPADNPASDAFALLRIVSSRDGAVLFEGWMLASSPALNPLDDSRYDVWVLRCNKS